MKRPLEIEQRPGCSMRAAPTSRMTREPRHQEEGWLLKPGPWKSARKLKEKWLEKGALDTVSGGCSTGLCKKGRSCDSCLNNDSLCVLDRRMQPYGLRATQSSDPGSTSAGEPSTAPSVRYSYQPAPPGILNVGKMETKTKQWESFHELTGTSVCACHCQL